jgi:hypothetical protein
MKKLQDILMDKFRFTDDYYIKQNWKKNKLAASERVVLAISLSELAAAVNSIRKKNIYYLITRIQTCIA